MGKIKKTKQLFWTGWFGAAIVIFFITGTAFAAPKLNLFPRNVTEQLRNTGQAAKSMESELRGVIAELDKQEKLFKASGCENSDDPGCSAISEQISSKYLNMLEIMKKSLPELKSSVIATNRGVEKNIRRELGKKVTLADIQRMLSRKAAPKVYNGRYSLSKRFAVYHRLLSSRGKNNLASLAAEIYLDTSAVIELIDLMTQEIERQSTILVLGKMYGTLTPEMTDTVSAVKTIIFGEPEDETTLPGTINQETSGFKSPLEME